MNRIGMLLAPALLSMLAAADAQVPSGASLGALGQPGPQVLRADYARTRAVISPIIHADRRVTFRLNAPEARDVRLTGHVIGPNAHWLSKDRSVPMTKGADGVWTRLEPGPEGPRDVQRELPGAMAVTIGYIGATGRDIGYYGTSGGNAGEAININQIDPAVARAAFPGPNGTWNAAALNASVANPFFGVAGAGEFAGSPTIQAGQLLRPFPQFGDVFMYEKTAGGRRQYNAATFVLDKRTTGSWGGRFSYTLSQTKDNQFGQSSTYQTRTATPQNNYDLDAEYGISNFDSPHRIILAPIVKFPGSKSSSSNARLLLNGWSASAVVELVSGSPLNAVMSTGVSNANLGLFGGRQRPNLTGDPNTSGSDDERVASDDNPDALYFRSAGFTSPGAGQYGTAPRADGDSRYQFRKNIDLVITKDTTIARTHTGEIRFEILNLTNTAKFRGIDSNAIDSSSFGRITQQAGFMRIWQLSFRYRF